MTDQTTTPHKARPRHVGLIGGNIVGVLYWAYRTYFPEQPEIPPEILINIGALLTGALGWLGFKTVRRK